MFALLHGGGQGSWVWDETAAVLRAAGATVIALDVPGCGTKRDVEAIGYSVDDVVAELNAEVRVFGPAPVVLVGHSQAGTLLPELWRKAPDLYARLIYLSACAPLAGQSVIDMMGHGRHGEHPDQIGWPLDPALHGKDEMRRLAFCNDMAPAQLEAFLPKLDFDNWPPGVTYAAHWDYSGLTTCPSTYIVCEQDGVLPRAWQFRFAERLACQRIITIAAGHQAMNTQPEALAALLLAETAG